VGLRCEGIGYRLRGIVHINGSIFVAIYSPSNYLWSTVKSGLQKMVNPFMFDFHEIAEGYLRHSFCAISFHLLYEKIIFPLIYFTFEERDWDY
jgi:hypothetical protein